MPSSKHKSRSPRYNRDHHRHSRKHKKQERHYESDHKNNHLTRVTRDEIKEKISALNVKISAAEKELQTYKSKKSQAKIRAKEGESIEDKRRRRLYKKECKQRKAKSNMGWDIELLGFTNEDNPFGDQQLKETFIWSKKLHVEGKGHFSREEIEAEQRSQALMHQKELESVRERRKQREAEREARQEEIEAEQRSREAEYFRTWAQQEDSFHLEQAKLRSRIRIAENRAKPIDLLSKYIADEEKLKRGGSDDSKAEEGSTTTTDLGIGEDIQLYEPSNFLVGLSSGDLEDLLEDINIVYMKLEQGCNADYWRDITVLVEAELDRKIRSESKSSSFRRKIAPSCNNLSISVMERIQKMLSSKSLCELQAMEGDIEKKLKGGEGVDINYWESVKILWLEQMARSRISERHEANLKLKLEQFKVQENLIETPPAIAAEIEDSDLAHEDSLPVEKKAEVQKDVVIEKIDEEPYEIDVFEPSFFQIGDLDIDIVIYSEKDDTQKIIFRREQVKKFGVQGSATLSEEDILLSNAQHASSGSNPDEAQFSVQANLGEQSFLWSDKYKPRKPRFFNRVHTGFEWNKYNQTHYDIENPPPKVVQGYKFNIFYSDLIDKTQSPAYKLYPCPEDADFAILRFSAGPPYEDIAFKIVNREWEKSGKRGFRCHFTNNVFQLWFHFLKYHYRR